MPKTQIKHHWRTQEKDVPPVKKLLVIIAAINFIALIIAGRPEVMAGSADKRGSYNISKLRLSGYGTISHTYDDNDEIMSVRDLITSSGRDSKSLLDRNSTWRMDSTLGIQAEYRFNSQAEFVIQGVLKDRADPSVAHSVEAAYLGFRPFIQTDIRVGRFSYDAFLMSDIRNTGYAYLWVRPPVEFYGRIPVFSVDGADAALGIAQGDANWRIRIQAGRSTSEMATSGETETYEFRADDLWTFSLSRQSGHLKVKGCHSMMTSANEFGVNNLLHQGLERIAAATAASFPDISAEALSLKNDMVFKGNRLTYSTLGAEYDDGSWVAQAEISRITASSDILPNGYSAYLSVGCRFGDFTPYSVFSKASPSTDLHKPSSDWDVIGQEELHSQLIHQLNRIRMEQYTGSLGLRWDFHNQAALKIQWDNTRISTYGYGLCWKGGSSLSQPDRVNLYSISMEFLF